MSDDIILSICSCFLRLFSFKAIELFLIVVSYNAQGYSFCFLPESNGILSFFSLLEDEGKAMTMVRIPRRLVLSLSTFFWP